MSPNNSASTYSSLRSGLCIDIPTYNSASLEGVRSRPSPTSRALSANTFSSGTKPVVVRTASESDSNASNMRPRPISGSHLLRSSTGMQGLLLAETGGGLVELDLLGRGTGFKQGTAVVPGLVTPGGTSNAVYHSTRLGNLSSKKNSTVRGTQRLSRHATLLSKDVTSARNSAELKSILGNSRSKIKSGAKLLPPSNLSHLSSSSVPSSAAVTLEQGNSRARVEVDILLDSDVCVEGGYLTGRIHVRVRKVRAKEAMVLMAAGKMRIVGFEGIPDNNDRHIFYQHVATLSTISSSSQILYSSGPDEEGFSQACEGQHVVPFAMKLPISEDLHFGAKGPFDNRSGVLVKYIAIVSFKLKDSATSKHSIAHFYRSCDIYPYFNSIHILAPASHPLLSVAARTVFLGGPGKLKLTANLHRNVWVAGQRCYVGIAVDNESKKAVKGLTLSLTRTTTIFRSRPHLDVSSSSSTDPDACQTTTSRKLVVETTIEPGQRGLRGHVTEKGWWLGVDPGVRVKFTHFILLPHDTLSIVRSRLVEVSYAIRISLFAGSLSSEVSVMLPLRIINNLSIDPPPSYPYPLSYLDIHEPLPYLPVAVIGSETVFSNLPRNTKFLDEKNGSMSGLDGRTSIFDEVIARGGVPASDGIIADALYGYTSSRQKSHILPRTEESLGLEDEHCSSVVSNHFRSTSGGSRFGKLQDSSVDETYFDDIEVNEAMDDKTVDDFTMDILRNFDSDEEVDSSIGAAGADEHKSLNWKSAAEFSEIEDYHQQDPGTVISVGKSAMVNERRKIREYASSRLPRILDTRAKITTISDPRLILRQDPFSKAKMDRGPLEAHTSKSSDVAQTLQMPKTPFSQRVEKLVAAHRAATALTHSVMATEKEKRRSLINIASRNDMALPNQCSNLVEPPLCVIPSQASSNKCPSTLTSSKSKIVMSDSTTISLSGTVRSRIAALEGRTPVAGQPTSGRVARQII